MVVLKMNFGYLAASMNEHVWSWEGRGFEQQNGGELRNAGLLKDLHSIMLDLEGKGVEVRYWVVNTRGNRDARLLVGGNESD